jgi:hypothetical protein
MPDTIPDVVPTVATLVIELLQRPGTDVELNVVVDPTQTLSAPVVAAGNGFTVNTTVV